MPEEKWAAHGGNPACDLCHHRKVKCDRKDPCANCATSGADCLRTRHKRPPRPRARKDDKLQALVQKLSSLENAINQGAATQITQTKEDASAVVQSSSHAEIGPRPPKRRLDGGLVTPREVLSPPESLASKNSQSHPPSEGLNFIMNELSHNNSLAGNQRSVLELAVSFIDQLSQTSQSAAVNEVWSHKVPVELTPNELLQILIANQHVEVASYVPPKAIEKMIVGLLEGTADSRTLTMYRIIVHFKAALNLYASQLQGPSSPAVREHIKKMQLFHLSAALTGLDTVSFLTSPSLLLLQTLLTGAILMHIIGNTANCWSLTAYASRTLVALGYHNIHTVGSSCFNVDELEEIHVAVAWCYHFDRLMSLLLVRSPSLPPLDVEVSSLVKYDPGNLMSGVSMVMLEMVPIHEKILEMTLESPTLKGARSSEKINADVEKLRSRMAEVYLTMEKSRPADLCTANPDYLLHWRSLEFKYYSTLTSVHRMSPMIASAPREREQCIQCARKALRYVKEIQNIGKQEGCFVAEYSPYLSWTILSYPLTPFFVLFCNVVGTSNVQDFELLQDVADSVSSLVAENKSVEKLHRLCSTLLAVCRPMVYDINTFPRPTASTAEATVAKSAAHEFSLAPAETDVPDPAAGMPGPVDGLGLAPWDDEMMWQVFQCQPSLDWFESDILDPAAWELNTSLMPETQYGAPT